MLRKGTKQEHSTGRHSTAQHKRSQSIVFLGGGRITSALIAGLRLAGYKRPIVVHDHNPEKLRALRREFHIQAAADLESALARADTLIIAVRPTAVADLLEDIKRSIAVGRGILAISLAAGVPLKKLRARLGPPILWARAMPSPVCRIGRGLTAVAFNRRIPQAMRIRVKKLFAKVGQVLEIPESHFDAFCVAFSPSHGYHALATLADAAQASGLDHKTALGVAAHALSDALFYWKESGQTAAELLEESATPGGTAAAAMEAMKKTGYEKAIAAGLLAGIQRARRNAKL